MTIRPQIGLLMDYDAEGSFSRRPYYALRTIYFDAIWRAGGMPVAVPYIDEAIETYARSCAGFVFPGGFYPFPAKVYGRQAKTDELVHPRHAFEVRLMKEILRQDVPVLGICAGMQVIAVVGGATLYNNISKETGTQTDHLNGQPAEKTAHGITLPEGTLLRQILQTDTMQVNTAHNESIKTVPDGLLVNAVADDGIIEGVEMPSRTFCLGVQWHPEFFAMPGDPNFRLFEALISASNGQQA